ncbi:MAG: hypothetical protein AAF740_02485 [Bacteroidota bacterium]
MVSLLLIGFLTVIGLAGIGYLISSNSGKKDSVRLQAAFTEVEEKYERLVDQELSMRWSHYQKLTSVEERSAALTKHVSTMLKPEMDRLIYLTNRTRPTESISSQKHFKAPAEYLNGYLRSRISEHEQAKFRDIFREAIQANLYERVLYLES